MKPKTILESEWCLVPYGGDSEALYRDGVKIKDGHSFSTDEVFDALGISLDYMTADPTSPRPFPMKLSDVIPFDTEAAEKRRKEDERLIKIELLEKEIAGQMKKLDTLRGVK